MAARSGRLDVLKYAHENGCPWNEETCAIAAEYGHLDILKYLHKNGCPWDGRTWSSAYEKPIKKWLRKNGCPQDYYDDEDDHDGWA